jgi:hypothetical protein
MDPQNPFKWRHFEAEIILLCVRWYLRYAGTRIACRSQHHLSLGAALCPGDRQTLSASPQGVQRFLARDRKKQGSPIWWPLLVTIEAGV